MNNPFENLDARLSNIENLLLDIKHKPQAQAPPAVNEDELLTIQQTAELLNLKVSTLYGLTSRKEIPHMKKNKLLYFSKRSILDWVKSGRRKSISEIAAEADEYLRKQKKG